MAGKKTLLLLVIMTGFLLVCGTMCVQSRLDESIRANNLIDEEFVEKGAPPLVAFTTMALGSFRGLIADFLWFRAVALQEEGKYFEMVQLASWIMKLQPKSTATAAYLGWNMAYNISVTYSRPEDRWRWVNNGIELYHEALQYNPNDPALYKELGWIYQHKLGNVLDDAQRYYKWQMALAMFHILGKHYPDWKRLATAPAKEQEFLARVKDRVKFLKGLHAAGWEGVASLFEAFRAAGGKMPEKVTAQFRDDPDELEALTAHFRVRWLYERFMLEPRKILEINARYGELDWFLPESFAIYWATLGAERSPERKSVDSSRMITQSLQVMFTNGRMLYPGEEPSMRFLLIPNLAVVDTVRESYRLAMEENPNVRSFKSAYQNFMQRAALTLFSYGDYTKSRQYYETLRREYKRGLKAGRLAFEPFIYSCWREEIQDAGFKQAQDLINGMIVKGCILLAYGDGMAADSYLRLAEICYGHYRRDQREERTQLPPFARMKSEIAKTLMKSLPSDLAARLRGYTLLEAQEKAEESPAADNARTAGRPDAGGPGAAVPKISGHE